MSKYDDVRIVTFKEDYGVQKTDKNGDPLVQDGKPVMQIYYKKSTGPRDKHAIHKNVVKKLEKNGAKMVVEQFDRKGYVKKAKEAFLERRESKGKITTERR